MTDQTAARHQVTRIRREPKRRALTVTAVEDLTPKMRRIHLTGADLADFESGSPDDHIKIFFPATPEQGGNEHGFAMRDFTPRAFDTAKQTLVVDFALHDGGPATEWASAARAGDPLNIGGPRGSAVLPDDFDWYLLIADETAIPSVGRRLEELRAGVPVTTLAVIGDAGEKQSFTSATDLTSLWAIRDGKYGVDADLLIAALADVTLPEGEGYVWIAAEAAVARTLRDHVVNVLGHPKSWVKAAGYWAQGDAATHTRIED